MVFIVDSHPVQYKAPVYQRLQQLRPGSFRVIYATDSSVRGHLDREFGRMVAWDTPLLEGYEYTILHNEHGEPFHGFRSLTGRGMTELLRRERPAAVLISQFLYEFDFVTYLACRRWEIPIWIRHETQDEAFRRPAWKARLRTLAYRITYAGVSHAFYIGQLNREHLLRHGMAPAHMSFAPYCSPVRIVAEPAVRRKFREETRERLKAGPDTTLVLFSGKLIDKKNPGLILEAFSQLAPEERARLKIVFVGSGPLEESLRAQAAPFAGQIHFAGFLNQSEISAYYLAADILVLPSRRAGETWGLVVNEALEAGCSVIVTDAVGCHREFGTWERVRVIPDGDPSACARALLELAALPPDPAWCAARMEAYSVDAAAQALARQIDRLAAGTPKLASA